MGFSSYIVVHPLSCTEHILSFGTYNDHYVMDDITFLKDIIQISIIFISFLS
ncbi:hypothetical protein LINPERHAP1_LOCUS14635 [Linum perenne]